MGGGLPLCTSSLVLGVYSPSTGVQPWACCLVAQPGRYTLRNEKQGLAVATVPDLPALHLH